MTSWQQDVIDDLADGATYTCTRRVSGSYSLGLWSPGNPSSFTIVAMVTPGSDGGRGRQKITLPEGVRTEDVRAISTTTALRTQDLIAIAVDGVIESFEVFTVETFELDGERNYLAHAAKTAVT